MIHCRRALLVLFAVVALLLGGCASLFGPEPPSTLKQAATDPEWAAEQIAKLPKWSKGQTTQGIFFRPGTKAKPLNWPSGRDSYARYANAVLKGSRRFNPEHKPGPFDAAHHSEDKSKGCSTAVPVVLAEGYRLVVWSPGDGEPDRTTLDGGTDE